MCASRGWAVVAALVVGGGWALRWWQLGEPNLWWDELVQIRMADRPSLWQVVEAVRLGVPAGAGNAGAVPLDYVLLWAWLRTVSLSAPEGLEAYVRAPSFAWSCALLPLVGWWTWRTFGRAAGIAVTVLTAGSIPLVLYAAEARFYSLFCFAVVLNLATFTALVRTPGRVTAWVAYAVAALALFLSGLLGLLVLPWQFATIGLVAVAGPATPRRRALGALALVALVLGAVVALYFADTNVATRSVRGPTRLPLWRNTVETLGFFGMGNAALPWALGSAPLVAVAVAWRGHRALLPVVACTGLVVAAALPVILGIAESKEHFFHPRHALFLLPMLLVLLGVAIGGLAESLVPPGRRWTGPTTTTLALTIALVLAAPAAWRYATAPMAYFARTKMLHDFRTVAQTIRDRTRDYDPDDRYLLIATRGPGGYLGNPVLAWYFEWYGIGDRVALRGTSRPAEMIVQVRERCRTACRRLGGFWDRQLRLESAYQLTRAKRRLLGAPVARLGWPGDPRHIAFLVYPPLARWDLGPLTGYRVWRGRGVHLYELARYELARPLDAPR